MHEAAVRATSEPRHAAAIDDDLPDSRYAEPLAG